MPGDAQGLDALLFDGRSARARRVRVQRDGAGLLIVGEDLRLEVPLEAVDLQPRLGRTQRQLRLPAGEVLECDDSPVLDTWFDRAAHRRGNLLARLESHRGAVLLATGTVLAVLLAFALWGLPWLAGRAAATVPQAWVAQLGKGTLAGLDRAFGAGSGVDAARQAALRARLAAFASEAGLEARFEFRGWERLGANALALPDGTIVITDGMVELATDERELLAVVAHELGHVEGRHALQALLNDAGIAALVFVITGDVSGLSNIAVVAPTVLGRMRHSRDLERSADRYGLALLRRQGIEPRWFASIIRKLEARHAAEQGPDDSGDIGDWLRSHPDPDERARLAEQS